MPKAKIFKCQMGSASQRAAVWVESGGVGSGDPAQAAVAEAAEANEQPPADEAAAAQQQAPPGRWQERMAGDQVWCQAVVNNPTLM